MEILNAQVEDAPAIARIARSLLLEGRDLTYAETHGFFIFAGTTDHYAKMIRESRYCYVAKDDGQCIGFITTREPAGVASLKPSPSRDLFLEDGEFPLVLEQIGVLPEWQDRGVGQALLDHLVNSTTHPRITATLVVGPIRNERSVRFFGEKNGWVLRRQAKAAARVWNFYELRR